MDDLLKRAKHATNYRTTDPLVGELVKELEQHEVRWQVATGVFEKMELRLEAQKQELERVRKILEVEQRLRREFEAAARSVIETLKSCVRSE